MDNKSEAGSSAIGLSLLTRAPLDTEHPIYKSVAAGAHGKLKEISKREEIRNRGKKRILSMEALTAEESKTLAALFPEFYAVDYGTSNPGHALVASIINLSGEWCISQALRHSSRIVHVGGVSGNHILSGRDNVHITGDLTDDLYVHKVHENTLNLVRYARDCANITGLLGKAVDIELIASALKGEKFSVCPDKVLCQHGADVLVVDGMTCVLGPKQVAAAMAQLGSSVAYGFFPFTPGMLVADEGYLGNTDVYFNKTVKDGFQVFEFVQSNGQVMVKEYPILLWSQWVRNHVISIVWKNQLLYFQFELLVNRSCVLFYRMIKLSGMPGRTVVSHAFDLPMYKDMYLVSSWKLKSLTAKIDNPSSWEAVTFTADRRLVDRVYSFGMQLNQKDFTRFAIRKQLKITNDRVVIAGTGVTWHAPLTPAQSDQLSIALFARLFVDRFDAGRLSNELMSKMRSLTAFSDASALTRIAIIAGLSMSGLWDSTFGKIDEAIRRLCDNLRGLVESGRPKPKIDIVRAPMYMDFSSVTRGWLDRFKHLLLMDTDAWAPGFNPNIVGYLSAVVSASKFVSVKEIENAANKAVPGAKIVTLVEESDGSVFQPGFPTDTKSKARELLIAHNEMDFEPVDRHVDLTVQAKRVPPTVPAKPDFDVDPDPVHTLNSVYDEIFPGNSLVDSRYDVASNVFDNQDRNFSARYMKVGHTSGAPKAQRVYVSRIKALNVPKRQETLAELLSATAARNLDPPVVSRPQSYEDVIPDIWENFKRKACRPDVEALLAKYRDDPTGLGEEAFSDWMDKAKDTNTIERVASIMSENAKAVQEYDVGSYVAMNKADVKVPLSDKTQHERIEPQVIVYHDKFLSACYSTIFRVMVNRFLSLLNVNVHINLRKDTGDIAAFINALHPYDAVDAGLEPQYLENDFSKYDKSQLEIVFVFEKFVFEQLGMNQEFIDKWFLGHMDCKIRSFLHSFSLLVAWQRKSGDATTAFGNVILNAASVLYAYPISEIYWMVFMGDDSILCTKQAASYDKAVKILAEVFNLQAKTYITEAPYFASNFIVINQSERTTALLPDPIKRIERWSMDVSALEDTWEEKFISAADVCQYYKYKLYLVPLSKLIIQRYANLDLAAAERLSNAIATLVSNRKVFRSMAEEESTIIMY